MHYNIWGSFDNRGRHMKINHSKPAEILEYTISAGVTKANSSFSKLVILGVLAGAFIALAGMGSNMAAFNLLMSTVDYGIGKLVAAFIFTVGLMLVVLAGGELFTGNCLMSAALLEKKISFGSMIRNWGIVYFSNLIGAVVVSFLIVHSGLLNTDGGLVGALTVKIAAGKVNMSFLSAFVCGIMCNWLVCLAVWIGTGAESTVDKIFGMFFPILLFVVSGYEHSVANMFYIPAGIMAKSNEIYVNLTGLGETALENLNWGGFFVDNLIPVTLGNIIGGAVFVGLAYWYSYKKA